MFATLAILTLLARAAPMVVQAWEGEPTASFAQCMRVIEGQKDEYRDDIYMEKDRMACGEAEWKRRDLALNRIYKFTRDRLPAAQRPVLADLERRWIAEREARCNAESETHPFDTEGMTFYLCRVNATNQRIIWLLSSEVSTTLNAPR